MKIEVTGQPVKGENSTFTKTYIGDGAYVEYDGFVIKLTTSNGISTTNEIYLEPEVMLSFLRFVNQLKTENGQIWPLKEIVERL